MDPGWAFACGDAFQSEAAEITAACSMKSNKHGVTRSRRAFWGIQICTIRRVAGEGIAVQQVGGGGFETERQGTKV